MDEEEFLACVEGLRFAGPNTDISKLVARHEVVDGVQYNVVCPRCRQNTWERHENKYYCWNCYDAPT